MVSKGSGSGQQQSQTESHVFRGQEPYLLDLYGKSSALADAYQPFRVDEASKVTNEFYPQNQEALRRLSGTSADVDDISSGENLGMQTLAGLQQQGPNPYLDSMVDAAGNVIERNLSRKIMPSIHDAGNAANPYGGGGTRQGIAEGIAMSDANQQLTDMASQIYGNAYEGDQTRRLQSADSYINQGLNAASSQAGIVQAMQQGAQGLMNLGLAPYDQLWAGLMNHKDMLGNPLVLSRGSSSGANQSSNFGIL